MNKRAKYSVELLSTEEPVDGVQNYYPFRLGMKTRAIINKKYFTIKVHTVKDNESLIPGFSCEFEEKSVKIYRNSTNAISSLYQQLFGTATKFSGPLIMAVFTQEIEKTGCFINIYIDNQLFKRIEDVDPNTTWKQTGFLKQYEGNALFGLEHYKSQERLAKARKLYCSPEEWLDKTKMDKLFNYHLRKRISGNIDWFEFFTEWATNNNEVVELHQNLSYIYPKNYIIADRELSAWHSMLKATGCTNITPFNT
ncbi:12687_t:CDS:2 [Gigaspora margarita]|uniref:12687_t:CDS:1 n=1 Tax=Gigaspora margarita TaxID=4874 RepID=A0ABN7VTF3_GIGMA|nr:12687_t:CDS:2 [Gigaspora margarita]